MHHVNVGHDGAPASYRFKRRLYRLFMKEDLALPCKVKVGSCMDDSSDNRPLPLVVIVASNFRFDYFKALFFNVKGPLGHCPARSRAAVMIRRQTFSPPLLLAQPRDQPASRRHQDVGPLT